MKKTKRFLSFALVALVMMLASCFAITVARADEDETEMVKITYDLGEFGSPVVVEIPKGEYVPYPGDNGVPATVGDNVFDAAYWDADYTQEFDGAWADEDMTIYLTFTPYDYIIHDVEIELELPEVGDEVAVDTYYDEYWDEEYTIWGSFTPQLEMTVPEDADYQPYEGTYADPETGDQLPSGHMYWLSGFEGEDYDTPYTGVIEVGGDYYLELVLEAKDDYIFDSNATIKVNGEDAIILYYDWDYISIGYLLHIPNEYTILDGENQTVGKDEDLTVRASGDLSRFVGVLVDGEEVSEDDYEVESGSTIVTLKAAFLNTLEVGKHDLTVLYDDGEVSTTFTIVRPVTYGKANPKTVDTINYNTITMLISVVGIAVLSLNKKYRFNN